VTSFINAGGNLFLSGSEIGWDLDQQNNGRTFDESTLKGNYVSDDAGTYTATANAGGIFAGMSSFVFSNGAAFSQLDSQYYDVVFPDVIAPQAGAVAALTYSGGTGGTAAIQAVGTGGKGSIVMFGFPFEAMTSAARRQTAMGRILDFFAVAPPAPAVDVKARVNGQDADAPTGPMLVAGTTAAFIYVITNPGNVPLSSVLVKDNNGTPGNAADDFNATYFGGDANSNGQLEVGETWTYSASRTVVAGQYSTTGSVTATGNAQSVMDTDPANYFGVVPNADFNGDSNVDASDFAVWRKYNGTASGAIHAQGDANYDGAVNGTDYAIWRSQFGTKVEGSSGTAIPENNGDLAVALSASESRWPREGEFAADFHTPDQPTTARDIVYRAIGISKKILAETLQPNSRQPLAPGRRDSASLIVALSTRNRCGKPLSHLWVEAVEVATDGPLDRNSQNFGLVDFFGFAAQGMEIRRGNVG
jgi:hypothetical protein